MNNFNETSYVTSETMTHHSLFKLLLCVDLGQFVGKVTFFKLGFNIENMTVMDSLEIIVAFDLEFDRYTQLNE